MATRSRIGYLENNKLHSVYCHWDGYPEGVGQVLFDHYQNINKIKYLIGHGDISVLSQNIEIPVVANGKHSFDSPMKGTTLFYHRDRGEALRMEVEDLYSNEPFKHGVSYFYIFNTEDNTWYVNTLENKLADVLDVI